MESDDLQSGWDGVTKAGVLRALKRADPGWDLKGAEKERARQMLKREKIQQIHKIWKIPNLDKTPKILQVQKIKNVQKTQMIQVIRKIQKCCLITGYLR